MPLPGMLPIPHIVVRNVKLIGVSAFETPDTAVYRAVNAGNASVSDIYDSPNFSHASSPRALLRLHPHLHAIRLQQVQGTVQVVEVRRGLRPEALTCAASDRQKTRTTSSRTHIRRSTHNKTIPTTHECVMSFWTIMSDPGTTG